MPTNINNLFKFISQETIGPNVLDGIANNDEAAPEIIPVQEFSAANPNPQLINVINGFEWTHTPADGRKDVPEIRLSEYRVEFNSLIQNIRYLLSTAKSAGSNILGGVKGTIDNLSIAQNKARAKRDKQREKDKKDKVDSEVTLLDQTLKMGESLAEDLKKATIDDSIVKAKHLRPYHGLYGLQPTGFEYKFPYFDSDWRNVNSQWTSIDGKGGLLGGFINEVANIGSDFVDTLGALPQVKGSGLERPQMYDYGQGGAASKTLKFSLINTDKFDDVVRNWQLCFMLLYQQLPNKISKVLYEPPVVYEVEIPGLFYTPFAYIRNIAITNRGAIRPMKIPVLYDSALIQELNLLPGFNDGTQADVDNKNNGTTPRKNQLPNDANRVVQGKGLGGTNGSPDPKTHSIETLIPDAYDITINIQSLVPESKNLFFHSTLGPATQNSGLYNVTLKHHANNDRLTPDWLPNPENRGAFGGIPGGGDRFTR